MADVYPTSFDANSAVATQADQEKALQELKEKLLSPAQTVELVTMLRYLVCGPGYGKVALVVRNGHMHAIELTTSHKPGY